MCHAPLLKALAKAAIYKKMRMTDTSSVVRSQILDRHIHSTLGAGPTPYCAWFSQLGQNKGIPFVLSAS